MEKGSFKYYQSGNFKAIFLLLLLLFSVSGFIIYNANLAQASQNGKEINFYGILSSRDEDKNGLIDLLYLNLSVPKSGVFLKALVISNLGVQKLWKFPSDPYLAKGLINVVVVPQNASFQIQSYTNYTAYIIYSTYGSEKNRLAEIALPVPALPIYSSLVIGVFYSDNWKNIYLSNQTSRDIYSNFTENIKSNYPNAQLVSLSAEMVPNFLSDSIPKNETRWFFSAHDTLPGSVYSFSLDSTGPLMRFVNSGGNVAVLGGYPLVNVYDPGGNVKSRGSAVERVLGIQVSSIIVQETNNVFQYTDIGSLELSRDLYTKFDSRFSFYLQGLNSFRANITVLGQSLDGRFGVPLIFQKGSNKLVFGKLGVILNSEVGDRVSDLFKMMNLSSVSNIKIIPSPNPNVIDGGYMNQESALDGIRGFPWQGVPLNPTKLLFGTHISNITLSFAYYFTGLYFFIQVQDLTPSNSSNVSLLDTLTVLFNLNNNTNYDKGDFLLNIKLNMSSTPLVSLFRNNGVNNISESTSTMTVMSVYSNRNWNIEGKINYANSILNSTSPLTIPAVIQYKDYNVTTIQTSLAYSSVKDQTLNSSIPLNKFPIIKFANPNPILFTYYEGLKSFYRPGENGRLKAYIYLQNLNSVKDLLITVSFKFPLDRLVGTSSDFRKVISLQTDKIFIKIDFTQESGLIVLDYIFKTSGLPQGSYEWPHINATGVDVRGVPFSVLDTTNITTTISTNPIIRNIQGFNFLASFNQTIPVHRVNLFEVLFPIPLQLSFFGILLIGLLGVIVWLGIDLRRFNKNLISFITTGEGLINEIVSRNPRVDPDRINSFIRISYFDFNLILNRLKIKYTQRHISSLDLNYYWFQYQKLLEIRVQNYFDLDVSKDLINLIRDTKL